MVAAVRCWLVFGLLLALTLAGERRPVVSPLARVPAPVPVAQARPEASVPVVAVPPPPSTEHRLVATVPASTLTTWQGADLGATVTWPWPGRPDWSGTVIVRSADADGVQWGASGDGTVADLRWDTEGGVEGFLWFKGSARVWVVEGEPGGPVQVHETTTDQVICAPRGALFPRGFGLPAAAVAQGESEYSPPPSADTTDDPGPWSSLPGSPRVIWLDFDAGSVTGTTWNTQVTFGYPIPALPAELTKAEERLVWERSAEDFAPFDINVTTDAAAYAAASPASRVHVILTTYSRWYDTSSRVFGVAMLNTFGNPAPSPAWVFVDNIPKASGRPNVFVVADTISHEAGHAFGLRHHGTNRAEYYAGHVNWSPLMGNGSRRISQWAKGEYTNANRSDQDDLALIEAAGGGVPRRADDHGNTATTATPVALIAQDGGWRGEVAGLLDRESDVDAFSFTVPEGSSQVWWDLWGPFLGPNAALQAELRHASGELVGTPVDPGIAPATAGTATVTPGVYTLLVRGAGRGSSPATGFSAYGSVGHYQGRISIDIGPTTVVEQSTDVLEFTIAGYQTSTSTYLTNRSGFTSQFLIGTEPENLLQPIAPITLASDESGTVTLPVRRDQFGVEVREGWLTVQVGGGSGVVRRPIRMTATGAILPSTITSHAVLPDRITQSPPPLMSWTLGAPPGPSGSWQHHYLETSRPDLLAADSVRHLDLTSSQSKSFNVRLNRDLPPGDYSETITITARPGTPGFPVVIPYSFTIPVPTLEVNTLAVQGWTTNLGVASTKALDILGGGSSFPIMAQVSSSAPWLSINSASGTTPFNALLSVANNLPAGLYEADIVVTPTNFPTSEVAAQTRRVTLRVNAPGELQANPPAVNFEPLPSNSYRSAITFSRTPGTGPSLSYALSTTVVGATLSRTSMTLRAGESDLLTITVPSDLPLGVTTGVIRATQAGGLALEVPVTLNRTQLVGQNPTALATGQTSRVLPALLPNRPLADVEVRLRGVNTTNAASLRVALKPPIGLPVMLLAGAAEGVAWEDRDLTFGMGRPPLPGTGPSANDPINISPSVYPRAAVFADPPPPGWPAPPYGRPLEDLLSHPMTADWELWIEGDAEPGRPLLERGWELNLRQDTPSFRPGQRWIVGDVRLDQEDDLMGWISVAYRNFGTNPEFPQVDRSPVATPNWVSMTQYFFDSGLTYFWHRSNRPPGWYREALPFTFQAFWNRPQTLVADLQIWSDEDWGASRLVVPWEVKPGATTVNLTPSLTGPAEDLSGLEVILSDLEVSDWRGLGLTLRGPDGHLVPLVVSGSRTGPFLGTVRFLPPDSPPAWPGNPGEALIITPNEPDPAGIRAPGLAAWRGRSPRGSWQLQARWDASVPGRATLREGWAIRWHARQTPVTAMPKHAWIEVPPGQTGRTRVRFQPPIPDSGPVHPVSQASWLTVRALGDRWYELEASAPAPADSRTTTTVEWWVAGDAASPYPSSVTARVFAEAVPDLPGAGRTVFDGGHARGGSSPVEIRGRRGPVQNVEVHLHGLVAPAGRLVRAVLEGPDGQGYILFSNATLERAEGLGRVSIAGDTVVVPTTELREGMVHSPQRFQASAFSLGARLNRLNPGNLDLVRYRRANGIWKLHLVDMSIDSQEIRLGGWDLSISTVPGYELWQQEHAVGEPDEDPDGDGWPNLQEWYFGSSPTLAEPGNLGLLPQAGLTNEGGVARLTLTYRRSVAAGLVVEAIAETWNADQGKWVTAPVFSRHAAPTSDPAFEQVETTIEASPSPHQIVRLRLVM